jgi:hypothetical protein
MHTRRNLIIIAALVIGLIALALFARQNLNPTTLIDGNNVIFADDYRVDAAVDGDLVVLARKITVGEGANISGSASLIGSEITVDGRIAEDLTVLGEQIRLGGDSAVAGDVSLMGSDTVVDGVIGGNVLINSEIAALTGSARAQGTVTLCGTEISAPDDMTLAPCPEEGVIRPFEPLIALRSQPPTFTPSALSPLGMGVMVVGWALLMTGAAAITVSAFPRQISHIEDAVRARPSRLWGVGIALYALGVGVTLALITLLAVVPPLGLIALPFYLIAVALLLVLTLCGLITLALVLGDLIAQRVSSNRLPPLVAAVTGSLVLSAGIALLVLLPFGWLADALIVGAVSALGLGAALVTRMGTRPLNPAYFVQG